MAIPHMIILIALATFVSTMIGGLFALRFRDKLHLILGFSAGAIVAVAFFDLLPEALDLGARYHGPAALVSFTALGFLAYLVLDRTVFLHSHCHEEGHDHGSQIAPAGARTGRGPLGAASLSVHSFLDGLAIGLAFQVSPAVGAVVAVAVLTHDFSDGINTVGLILKDKGSRRKALRWLLADALAPVLGAASTLFFALPERYLSVILALFAGFFIYIGATDLIPESHHAHPKFLTTAMTLLGAAVLYAVIHFANI